MLAVPKVVMIGESIARLYEILILDEFEVKNARNDVSPVPFSEHGMVTIEGKAGTSHH